MRVAYTNVIDCPHYSALKFMFSLSGAFSTACKQQVDYSWCKLPSTLMEVGLVSDIGK